MSVHLSDETLHGNGEDPDDAKNYVDDEATEHGSDEDHDDVETASTMKNHS